jgi:hypothetical protein
MLGTAMLLQTIPKRHRWTQVASRRTPASMST